MSNKNKNSSFSFFLLIPLLIAFVLGTYIGPHLPTGLTIESPSNGPIERLSPSDTIKQEDIHVYKNGVRVTLNDGVNDWLIATDLSNPSWASFTDTNSMDPLFDVEANTVRIKIPCESVQVGDIITYEHPTQGKIIHRVVHKDQDQEGSYFVLKGDNNPTNDPGKVRCDQVLGKVVAIFY